MNLSTMRTMLLVLPTPRALAAAERGTTERVYARHAQRPTGRAGK